MTLSGMDNLAARVELLHAGYTLEREDDARDAVDRALAADAACAHCAASGLGYARYQRGDERIALGICRECAAVEPF